MTPDDQRIAIGKLCGWEPCEPRVFVRVAPSHAFMKDGAYYGGLNALPRYLEDLNAMHEAEKVLTAEQFTSYLDWLDVECGGELALSDMVSGPELVFGLAHATAEQRAAALLKSLGLWVWYWPEGPAFADEDPANQATRNEQGD
jgi:hypothetical protein